MTDLVLWRYGQTDYNATRRVQGRVVAPELDDLGAAVVGSYLSSRRGTPGGYGYGTYSDWFGGRGFWVDD